MRTRSRDSWTQYLRLSEVVILANLKHQRSVSTLHIEKQNSRSTRNCAQFFQILYGCPVDVCDDVTFEQDRVGPPDFPLVSD